MSKKFKHLNLSPHWQQYFSKYPQGYTIIENLIDWVSQVDNMVDNQNELNETVETYGDRLDEFIGQYDTHLQETVEQTLSEWQDTGFLDVVIDSALDTKYHEMDERLTTQLDQIAINGMSKGLTGDAEKDDTQAFRNLINNHIGEVIYLPNGGIYNLATWTTMEITKPLTIIGMPGDKKPIIRGLEDVSLFTAKAEITIVNVAFESWELIFDYSELNTTVDQFTLQNCAFTNIRNVARSHPNNKTAKIRALKVTNCDISLSRNVAFGFTCKIERATFKGNSFDDIGIRAISIGKNAPSPEEVLEYQDFWSNIFISDNTFKNIHREDVGETQAIIVYGWRVNISGNSIQDLENFADPTRKSLEGIYLKCRYSTVADNTLINASGEQGAINIKGQPRGLFTDPSASPESYGNVIRGNRIVSRKPMSSGIHFQSADILIEGNYIEGVTYRGIWALGSESGNVRIHNNHITEMLGREAIYLRTAGENIFVTDNIIDNNSGEYGVGRSVGIFINLPSGYNNESFRNYRVEGNTIRNSFVNDSDGWAIRVDSSGGTFDNTFIKNNIIENVFNAINLGSACTEADVFGNSFDKITGTKVTYLPEWTEVRFGDNKGLKTKSIGSVVLIHGRNSVTVEHGLDIQPPKWGIQVSPQSFLDGIDYRVLNANETTFDIELSEVSSTSKQFAWVADAETV